ncbi:hypothetical protein JCM3765_007716 [Sporobolomyces pararoseus]
MKANLEKLTTLRIHDPDYSPSPPNSPRLSPVTRLFFHFNDVWHDKSTARKDRATMDKVFPLRSPPSPPPLSSSSTSLLHRIGVKLTELMSFKAGKREAAQVKRENLRPPPRRKDSSSTDSSKVSTSTSRRSSSQPSSPTGSNPSSFSSTPLSRISESSESSKRGCDWCLPIELNVPTGEIDLTKDFCQPTRRKIRKLNKFVKKLDLDTEDIFKVHTAGMLVISGMMPLDIANEAKSLRQREEQDIKIQRMEQEEEMLIKHLEETYLEPIRKKIEKENEKRWKGHAAVRRYNSDL